MAEIKIKNAFKALDQEPTDDVSCVSYMCAK